MSSILFPAISIPFANTAKSAVVVLQKSQNDITIDSYNKSVAEYIANTPQDMELHSQAMIDWIERALSTAKTGRKVFEIGSATVRDAKFMREHGFQVVCSDAAEGFVQSLRRNSEADATLFNPLKDKFDTLHSLIYANGVVPHFTSSDFATFLRTVEGGLEPSGVLAFSVKLGIGENWVTEKISEKRYVKYWLPDDICRFVEEHGYSIAAANDNFGTFPGHHWFNIIAIKNEL
jgi:cyclopropane fatty-acyl-phospholipid synthase-like methyltransferase